MDEVALDLIIFDGAPGIGKCSLCKMLGESFGSPVIDFGILRWFHLDRDWRRQSDEEEMSFENFMAILNKYLRYVLKNIFINDLRGWDIV